MCSHHVKLISWWTYQLVFPNFEFPPAAFHLVRSFSLSVKPVVWKKNKVYFIYFNKPPVKPSHPFLKYLSNNSLQSGQRFIKIAMLPHGILLATCCEVNAQNINLLSRSTVMLRSIFIICYHILLHGNVSIDNFVSMQLTVPLGKTCYTCSCRYLTDFFFILYHLLATLCECQKDCKSKDCFSKCWERAIFSIMPANFKI